MFTLVLAVVHARSTNDDFSPTALYIGTFIIDLTPCELLLKVFA